MTKSKRKAIINKKYCVACGSCVPVCPFNLIHIEQGIFAQTNLDKCVGCGKCAKECPACVIKIEKIEVNE